jgi:two-component system, NtrC family, sensor kinase
MGILSIPCNEDIQIKFKKVMSKLGLRSLLPKLRVGQKIALGYGCALGIALLGSASGLLIGDAYQQKAFGQEDDALEEMEIFDNLKFAVLENQKVVYQLAHAVEDPVRWKLYEERLTGAIALLRESWTEFQSLTESEEAEYRDPEEEIILVDGFVKQYEEVPEAYARKLEELLQQVSQVNGTSVSPQMTYEQMERFVQTSEPALRLEDLMNDLARLIEVIHEEHEEAVRQISAANQLRSRIIFTSLLLSSAVASILALYTGRSIVRPIQVLTNMTKRSLQESNFDLHVPIQSQDEIGELAQSFNQLIASVDE